MTPEAQRIAIAEAYGWKAGTVDKTYWKSPLGDIVHDSLPFPNYLSDLNAMHEAEGTLVALEDRQRYCKHLCNLTDCDPLDYGPINGFNIVTATAAQRAEAFLWTLNLWDGKK